MDSLLDAVDDGFEWMYRSIVPPTPQERLRSAHLDIRKNVQRLKMETGRSLREEAKLRNRMRAEASRGETSAVKATASSIVRGQVSRTSLNKLQNRLNALQSRLEAATTTQNINSIIKDATAAMSAIGSALGGNDLQKTVMNFERQNTAMSMITDEINDVVDECEDEPDLEGGESLDDQVRLMAEQAMDEITLKSMYTMPSVPLGATHGAARPKNGPDATPGV